MIRKPWILEDRGDRNAIDYTGDGLIRNFFPELQAAEPSSVGTIDGHS
jgi:hypothetical protein